MVEQWELHAFFPAEHDEEGGQQGNKGGQDGPAGKKRGEQAAEHSPGDEGADQSIVDPDLLQRGPLPVEEPVEQMLRPAAQVAGTHGGDAAAALELPEGLYLKGACEGDDDVGHRIQGTTGQAGDQKDGAALCQ